MAVITHTSHTSGFTAVHTWLHSHYKAAGMTANYVNFS